MSYEKIISINCGSSSVKFSVFKLDKGCRNALPDLLNIDRILSCKIEEIGTEYGSFILKDKDGIKNLTYNFSNHEKAIRFILKKIKIGHLSENKISAAVHRYVHGGKYYKKPLIVSDADIKKLTGLNGLAPLHNPSNLKGLQIMKTLFPEAAQICVFDTAFHGTIPKYARLYPIPISYSIKYGIEKFGFHGISYSFVVNLLKIYEEGKNIGNKLKKIIICHLGNGASICAVKNGKSADTSMGYTPLEGLMMGTRSGSIDPEVPFILKKKLNLTDAAAMEILNKKSGLLGVSKKTYDFKELEKQTDKYSKLALKMYVYRIVEFIGQYAAVLNGTDALVFTGGIGENSATLRDEVCAGLTYLGIDIDAKKNKAAAEHFRSGESYGKLNAESSVIPIQTEKSRIKVFALHTDEELQMVFESVKLLS
jgi:acetate kinase